MKKTREDRKEEKINWRVSLKFWRVWRKNRGEERKKKEKKKIIDAKQEAFWSYESPHHEKATRIIQISLLKVMFSYWQHCIRHPKGMKAAHFITHAVFFIIMLNIY
jgi:hypothetical protein